MEGEVPGAYTEYKFRGNTGDKYARAINRVYPSKKKKKKADDVGLKSLFTE